MRTQIFTKSLPKIITNSAITLLVLSGIGNILFSLPYPFKFLFSIEQYYRSFNPDIMVIHRSVSIITGFLLVLISNRLYKRMQMAWMITMATLPISVMLHIFKYHGVINVFTIIELIIIVILGSAHKQFKKASNPITIRWGIMIALFSFLLVILYTAIGIFLLKKQYTNIQNFQDAFIKSLQLLFLMDNSIFDAKTKWAVFYIDSAIIVNWACIISGIVLVLKPLVYQPIVSSLDREKVRKYIEKYSSNPIGYVAIEKDKKYFFGTIVEGCIAYILVKDVVVCAGDPICKEEEATILLGEFINFCNKNDLDTCFCQVSEKYLSAFQTLGFGITKYGEEAMFYLPSYTIKGGKAAKVRQAINNANREGIIVKEYKPLVSRDRYLEEKMEEVSKEWLSIKKSGELSFMLGSVSLDNPMDRRYFVAMDRKECIQGFVVFTPFQGKNGYYADVTRRRKKAPMGVMEKIIISAFEKMKEEEIEWGSLGLAPLADTREGAAKRSLLDAALEFVYEHFNNFYGFKTLHQYKKKYNPTQWEMRYLTYYPKIFTPKIAYAIIKAQNTKGITDYLFTQIKTLFYDRVKQFSRGTKENKKK